MGTAIVKAGAFLRISAVLLLIVVFSEGALAQSGDLRSFVRESIYQTADSLFRVNGEEWSGVVWSAIPELRSGRRMTRGTPLEENGFKLEELNVTSAGSSVDPSGRELRAVTISVRGDLLMSDGRMIPVNAEYPASILHAGEKTFEETYSDLLKKDSSVWSNVVVPVVVALGAAVIVALFFFVRS